MLAFEAMGVLNGLMPANFTDMVLYGTDLRCTLNLAGLASKPSAALSLLCNVPLEAARPHVLQRSLNSMLLMLLLRMHAVVGSVILDLL